MKIRVIIETMKKKCEHKTSVVLDELRGRWDRESRISRRCLCTDCGEIVFTNSRDYMLPIDDAKQYIESKGFHE